MYEYGKKVIKKFKNFATSNDGIFKKKKKKAKKKKKIIPQVSGDPANPVNIEIKDLEDQINDTEDEFSLSKEGKIEYAQIHTLANRPLCKIQEFNSSTKFCPCCNLPAQQEGVLVPFKYCDSIDKFAVCGEGVSLYFIFFKFCIISLLLTSIVIGTTNIYFNYKYSHVVIDFCNNYLKTELMPYNNTKFYDECKIYFTEAEKDSDYFSYDNQLFFQFSAVNVKNYRKIYSKIYSDKKNDKFEKNIINVRIINFICLISVFIFNLIFIYYIYNKSNSINYNYLLPSDYSVLVSNLYDVHKKFLQIKKEILEKKEKSQNLIEGGTSDNIENEFKERLGIIVPISEVKYESEEFKYFLKNKVFVGAYNEYNLIDNIVLCSKLDKYKQLEKKIEEIAQKINKIKFDDDQIEINSQLNLEGDERKYFSSKYKFMFFHCKKTEEMLGDLKKQKEEAYKELDELYQDSRKNTINYFGGSAFITFSTLKEQELFLKNFKYSFCGNFLSIVKKIYYMLFGYCINKNDKPVIWFRTYINFEQADEPSDIVFENLEYTQLSKIIRTFVVYVISFLFAIFSNSIGFVIIAGLNALLDFVNRTFPHPLVQYATSFVISLFSTFLNYIYENIFDILTNFEKQTTMTKYYLSYSLKLTIFSFINSGVLPLLSEIYHPTDGHKTLINNMFMMFVVNSIYTPIKWSLNFTYFGKRISIWLIERKKDPDEEHAKTQKELNDLYELPNMTISIKYSYIAKTILMAFLYIPIFPFGIVISFLGFCLGYLLEKFNFCHIYKKPEMLGAKICKFYIDYFVIVLFVYALGDYFFLDDVYDTNIWSYINLIIFGVLIFVPYVKLVSQDYLKINKYEFFKKEFKECLEFNTDYERANPISIKEGKINYLKKLKEKNIITEKELLDNVKDIYNINIMQIYYKNIDKEKDLNKEHTLNLNKEKEVNKEGNKEVNNEVNKEVKKEENKDKNSIKNKVSEYNNELLSLKNNENSPGNMNFGINNNNKIHISKIEKENEINSNDKINISINNIEDGNNQDNI